MIYFIVSVFSIENRGVYNAKTGYCTWKSLKSQPGFLKKWLQYCGGWWIISRGCSRHIGSWSRHGDIRTQSWIGINSFKSRQHIVFHTNKKFSTSPWILKIQRFEIVSQTPFTRAYHSYQAKVFQFIVLVHWTITTWRQKSNWILTFYNSNWQNKSISSFNKIKVKSYLLKPMSV